MKPKKQKPTRLHDLLDKQFAEGYEQFQEFFEHVEATETLPPRERAFAFLLRLLTVAMTEGLNQGEEKFGLPPEEMMTVLWETAGAAVAGMNAQAFEKEGFGTVRREMRDSFMRSYRHTTEVMIRHSLGGEANG